MGQKLSKDELLYKQVIEGNEEAIKALWREGARLEWIDKEGKTPLIVASMDPTGYNVAMTLIELGAKVNAYAPGIDAGTPLHHAAKIGLDHNVKLLLSYGANPFTRNDNCHTPLDVARTEGHCNVVRAIEAHICYFSGDMIDMVVTGILAPLVPQRLARKSSKKCWVVVVPCGPPNNEKPPNLELAVYHSARDAQPRMVIPLLKSNIVEPKFHESDPSLTIIEENKTRWKFLSAIEGDKRRLVQLYHACKGFPKVMPSPDEPSSSGISPSQSGSNANNQPESSQSSHSQSSSATNGWGDLDDNSTHSGWGPSNVPPPSKASCNGWANEPKTEEFTPPSRESCNGWADEPKTEEFNGWADPGSSRPTLSPTAVAPTPPSSAPSAPPLPMDGLDDGPIHYPEIDVGPVDLSSTSGEAYSKTDKPCCAICWEAPIEGACVPCGHMSGCMSCLSEIKSKKGDCPVCRAKIDQVIRIYYAAV